MIIAIDIFNYVCYNEENRLFHFLSFFPSLGYVLTGYV